MSSTVTVVAVGLGFLHGFVVWNLLFRTVRLIAKRITPDLDTRVPISEAVAHVVVVLFLLVCALLLLGALGSIISTEQSRDLKGLLFLGSFVGWLSSGILPRIERGLRRRSKNSADLN